jgi:hypothetical protein
VRVDLLGDPSIELLADRAVAPVLVRYEPPAASRIAITRPPFVGELGGLLANRALAQRIAEVEEVGCPLGVAFVGCAPHSVAPIMLPAARGVVLPLALDPHFCSQALGMPWSVRSHVARLARSDLRFDTFYIFHELSQASLTVAIARKDLRVADLSQLLGPPKVDPVAQFLADGTERVARVAAVTLGVAIAVPVVAVTAIAALTVALAAIPAMAVTALAVAPAAGLDPVLLGAVSADGSLDVGTPAAFFHIASWR